MNGDARFYDKYTIEKKITWFEKVNLDISDYTYLFVKRLFDIFVGVVGTACLIPITCIIKICTLLTGDTKSIFYAQKRIGQNGKEFKLYKFRSMVPNAEEELEKILANNNELAEEYRLNKKLEDDPRITKIGRILRKTSLDETPQFINVLKGEMSLVGNRPYLPREKEDMGEAYDDIVKTKPGLTGYWQVMGRNEKTFEERLKLEKYYSNNATLRLDLKIFFMTFEVVLFGKGAK